MPLRSPPPILSARTLVFSDLNCPYCFTLNEWLSELGVGSRVRWVGVEHRPELPVGGANLDSDARQLAIEVADVGRRAPEVSLRSPAFWCNSRSALLLQNAAEVDEPEQAHLLRRRLFRGYWVDGVPLCNEALLAEERARFPHLVPEDENEELDRLTRWWRQHLDRIPAMYSPTGLVHIGLQDKVAVQRFVDSAITPAEPGPGCR